MHSLHHLAGDVEQQRDVSEHTRAGSLASNLLDRAAKVDIDHVGVRLFHHLGGLDHRLYVAAVDLYAYGAFLVVDDHLVEGGLDGAYHSLGRHKFGVDHCRTVTLAEHAETDVGHIFHRGEEERTFAKINSAYFHVLQMQFVS